MEQAKKEMTVEEIESEIEKLKAEVEKLKHTEDEIYLLSVEEYEKYKNVVPAFNAWWWLRSPGYGSSNAAGVDDDGSASSNGDFVKCTCGIRPALRFSSLKSRISKSKKGNAWFMFGEVRWRVIDAEAEIAISELPIGFGKFDYESNDYKNSAVRKWLLTWLEEQK